MFKTVVQDGDASLNNLIDGDESLIDIVDGEGVMAIMPHSAAYPDYTGPVEITPNQTTQILNTAFKSILVDIKVNPIPSNYGLITWNGSTLTVS